MMSVSRSTWHIAHVFVPGGAVCGGRHPHRAESKSSATVVTVVEDDALLEVVTLETTAYEGQKPGTSGLRKKTKVWMDGTYTHNFVTVSAERVERAARHASEMA